MRYLRGEESRCRRFVGEHGLCEQTFYYWRNRVRPDAILAAMKGGFAEVAVKTAGVSSSIIAHLSTGVLLEVPVGSDPAWVGLLSKAIFISSPIEVAR